MKEKIGLKDSYQIIKKIWKYTGKWKFPLFLAFIIGSTAPFFYAYINSELYQLFVSLCVDSEKTKIYKTFIILAVSLILAIVVYALCFGIIFVTNAKVKGKMRKAVYTHTKELPESYLSMSYFGDIATKITKDFNDAMELMGYTFLGYENPLAMFITIIGACLVIGWCNWILGLLSLALTILNLLVINHYIKPLQQKEKSVKEASSEAAQEIVNTISGMGVSRIFGFQDTLKERYLEKAESIYQNNISVIIKKTNIHLTADIQQVVSSAGVLLVGLFLALRGIISIPTVIFIMNMQTTLSSTAVKFGDRIANCQKNLVGAKRLLDYMDVSEEELREDQVAPNLKAEYAIKFECVRFRYKNTEKDIFNDLSLCIKKGENVALVGSSGGGKSTIFKLLMAFEERNAGSILLMGQEIDKYSYTTIRSMYSYVSQDCYLYDGTIRENILLGNPDATQEMLDEVIEKAYLSDFIMKLENGYDTEIGEGGVKLSGGQKQRIAIARAILKDAPIILLDEATSSLDSNSEEQVKKAFQSLIKGKTCITIAHRISTIQDTDQIFVLEDGRIVEQGKSSVLIEKNGRYAKLYRMQFAEYK